MFINKIKKSANLKWRQIGNIGRLETSLDMKVRQIGNLATFRQIWNFTRLGKPPIPQIVGTGGVEESEEAVVEKTKVQRSAGEHARARCLKENSKSLVQLGKLEEAQAILRTIPWLGSAAEECSERIGKLRNLQKQMTKWSSANDKKMDTERAKLDHAITVSHMLKNDISLLGLKGFMPRKPMKAKKAMKSTAMKASPKKKALTKRKRSSK